MTDQQQAQRFHCWTREELIEQFEQQAAVLRERDAQLQAAERREAALKRLRERAKKEPLNVDISDFSDEWCAGFLAGQEHALDVALAATQEEERR